MSINASNDNSNEKVENSYDFEAPMYCPYCLMPYNRPIQNEYTYVDPYDEDFDENFDYDFNPEYRHRGHRRRRRRRRRRRHRRRCRRDICEFPLFPLFYDYDDWYWY
ncbi:hypothetical protein [Clostridium kluyveri]|uniref:Uncharacterized protein n=2 Tax=Clostridium kluyveri TaxID=1534 RepID=A5N326_CLOK5|nr:hypothetical protein [Clostridium kluyveri]EDK35522.1 Hypothetical protein CKL_3531 [Clostridium kluyveri DSM 555]BAH08168.1 hypothetical protein CKR_3117 [Clostridium kluyveri NBRC 12016]